MWSRVQRSAHALAEARPSQGQECELVILCRIADEPRSDGNHALHDRIASEHRERVRHRPWSPYSQRCGGHGLEQRRRDMRIVADEGVERGVGWTAVGKGREHGDRADDAVFRRAIGGHGRASRELPATVEGTAASTR